VKTGGYPSYGSWLISVAVVLPSEIIVNLKNFLPGHAIRLPSPTFLL